MNSWKWYEILRLLHTCPEKRLERKTFRTSLHSPNSWIYSSNEIGHKTRQTSLDLVFSFQVFSIVKWREECFFPLFLHYHSLSLHCFYFLSALTKRWTMRDCAKLDSAQNIRPYVLYAKYSQQKFHFLHSEYMIFSWSILNFNGCRLSDLC